MVISYLGSLVQKLLRMKPKVVFVLGGPGAGKGTQCTNIVKVGGRQLEPEGGREGGIAVTQPGEAEDWATLNAGYSC